MFNFFTVGVSVALKSFRIFSAFGSTIVHIELYDGSFKSLGKNPWWDIKSFLLQYSQYCCVSFSLVAMKSVLIASYKTVYIFISTIIPKKEEL